MSDQVLTRTISFERLILGEQYERPYLAELWGYADWHAMGRGAVTPRGDNKIILFITKEKQEASTQYQDHFEGDILHIEGETNHVADDRIINAKANGDEIHLFFRERHHMPFTYFGQVQLQEYTRNSDRPSRFSFWTARAECLAASAIDTERYAHGGFEEDWSADPEGAQRVAQHIRYERSQKNRARALQIHGTRCTCCGFDFNSFYGPDLARDFIEVHHVTSITIPNASPDPAKDLIPVCSNCHSMLHRNGRVPMPVDMLRKLLAIRTCRSS